MRSVLIDGRLLGYRRGGIANYAANLAELVPGLAPDLDVRVLLKRPVRRLMDRSIRALTPPHHRFERFTFGAEVSWHRPDLFHATDYIQPLTHVPSVVTVHDLAFLTHPELVTADSYAYYARLKDTIREARAVIAVSEWTKSQVAEHLTVPEDRIRVVPNGIDHAMFHPCQTGEDFELLRHLNPHLVEIIDSNRPLILAAGTIEPRKRIDILINAFNRFRRGLVNIESTTPALVVVGQAGWLADSTIRELRELQRRGMAVWLRDVKDRELAALYRAAELLALPSVDEGFGIPALEAMASGTPVLAAANGALPELLRDTGFLEGSSDPGNWADKIQAILRDDEVRERRIKRGIDFASNFSWESTARQTIDVYREVLGKA